MFSFVINSHRQPLERLLFSRSLLLQFKEFELYWGAVFFSDLFTLFHDFSKCFDVVILVTPKQEVEQKSECFAA